MTFAEEMIEYFGRDLRGYLIPRAEDFRDDSMCYMYARLVGHFGRIALGQTALCEVTDFNASTVDDDFPLLLECDVCHLGLITTWKGPRRHPFCVFGPGGLAPMKDCLQKWHR